MRMHPVSFFYLHAHANHRRDPYLDSIFEISSIFFGSFAVAQEVFEEIEVFFYATWRAIHVGRETHLTFTNVVDGVIEILRNR